MPEHRGRELNPPTVGQIIATANPTVPPSPINRHPWRLLHPCLIARSHDPQGPRAPVLLVRVALGDCRQIMLPLCHVTSFPTARATVYDSIVSSTTDSRSFRRLRIASSA